MSCSAIFRPSDAAVRCNLKINLVEGRIIRRHKMLGFLIAVLIVVILVILVVRLI